MTSRGERLELALFSARSVATYSLAPGASLVVGREGDADIVIDDVAVSRRHAVFHAGPPVEVEDLGSANGTFVTLAAEAAQAGRPREQTADQTRVAAKRTVLAPGDTVHFGAALVVVRRARPAAGAAREGSQAATVVREPALARVYEEAARAAAMSLPVLILGETGVGKEVLARFIHARSPRAGEPLVVLNCAALSESLATSELFGHERGAFTGADQARPGVLEAADGGTLFLDEIGDLPLPTQAKLLRTLENAEVQRLGSVRTMKVDVRFLAATNHDLERACAEGRFRRDLFFRVNGIALHIPPLRERTSEIAELARHFVAAAAEKAGLAAAPTISPDAMKALCAHAWPGNVRELRYVMERALVTGSGPSIERAHLPAAVISGPVSPPGEDATSRERVVEALAACDGNQVRAAAMLGVSRRTLINRMEEYNLPRPRKG